MSRLVLGPMLRYVDQTRTTVWVETDGPCAVTVRRADGPSGASRTFAVHGRHYAVTVVSGLAPGTSEPYTVELDGEQVWPEPDSPFPPSRIPTVDPERPVRLLFGSCRKSVPNDTGHLESHGPDVLAAWAHELSGRPEDEWPTGLLLLGDQVYADEPPPAVVDFMASRRDLGTPPGRELADFEEYARLYQAAWATDPAVRWLLSTLPTAMIFDDHDLRDDWNISQAWQEHMGRQPWWRRRVVAGLGSYWVYQHLGNMAPEELAADRLLADLSAAGADGGPVLDAYAWRADRNPSTVRWSFTRDFGRTRLVVLDSRCARDLTPGARKMIGDEEWAWFERLATGDVDHLLIGSSLPILLPTFLHHLEAWNEAICDGKWGRPGARFGEWLRERIDLEHWAAFGRSFAALAETVRQVSSGQRGVPPGSVLFMSGDIHYSGLARAEIPDAACPVHQVISSPIRNPLPRGLRFANALGSHTVLAWLGRALAALAGVPRTPFRWRMRRGPWFTNAMATLELNGRDATVHYHTARQVPGHSPRLVDLSTAHLTR